MLQRHHRRSSDQQATGAQHTSAVVSMTGKDFGHTAIMH